MRGLLFRWRRYCPFRQYEGGNHCYVFLAYLLFPLEGSVGSGGFEEVEIPPVTCKAVGEGKLSDHDKKLGSEANAREPRPCLPY